MFSAKQVSLLMHLLFHYIPHTSEEAYTLYYYYDRCVSQRIYYQILFSICLTKQHTKVIFYYFDFESDL